MKTIKTSEIPSLIEKIAKRGARPLSIMLCTTPKVPKSCPIKGLQKLQMLNCFLNFKYENSVNRQRVREEKRPDFEVQPNWFEHTNIPAIVQSKTDPAKKFLQLKVESVLMTNFKDAEGNLYSFKDVQKYLPKRAKPKNQGIEKPVFTIVPSLASIGGFKVDGAIYLTKD